MTVKIKRSLAALAVVILLLSGYVAWEVSSPIRFDKPTGPYTVGTFGAEVTDSARVEDALPGKDRYRRLILQFWYPAEKTAGLTRAMYHPNPDYFDREVNKLFDIPEVMLSRLTKSTTNSWVNAPVSPTKPKYPVILFSHGMNGMRFLNTYQMEELASHGYIVVSVEHTFTALGTIFQDGSKGGIIPYERMENDSFANAMVDRWSTDQVFALDCIEKFNQPGNTVFSGKLDLEHIGILGFSFGGAVSTNTLVLDKRIKAGINLDGFYYGTHYETGFDQPFMEIRSQPASTEKVTEDELRQSHLTRARWKYVWFDEWNKRLSAYAKHAAKEPLSYTIEGADHFSFCDLPLMAPFPWLLSPETARIHRLTNAYTLAFFDQELKGINSVLLREHKKLLK